MSIPQVHDYCKKNDVLNLKETELTLGLPGSQSPEIKVLTWVSPLFGRDFKDENIDAFSQSPLKNFVSGAKRGFSDAIHGSSSKWGLSINGGSEVNFGKDDVLFSPRGTNGGSKGLQSSLSAKEIDNPSSEEKKKKKNEGGATTTPASKAQVVGWPPIRSFRKNTIATNSSKNSDINEKSGSCGLYVKVSMDGAPYLRKIDLKTYRSYAQLSSALEKMFTCFTIGHYGQELSEHDSLSQSCLKDLLHDSEYVLTYEDKDGDWMLVGDVPWEMFTDSCKRLRIMKGLDAIGLAPRSMQKCKNQN